MVPASDPRSPVSAERRVATCQKCHEGANANFAAYQPHADPNDRHQNATLYYTSRFMTLLLGGVFAFFGLHSGLWFVRSWKDMKARRGGRGTASGAKAGTAEQERHDGPRA